MNEVTILRDLSHPGVVKLLNVFQNGEIICVVMEKMNGGDLVINFFTNLRIFMNEVIVVSTVVSGVLFARFSTVECIMTIYSFLL